MKTDKVYDIKDKVIVLTGACGLIGKTVSRALCERDAKLVVVDVEAKTPEIWAQQLGKNALAVTCDVGSIQQVDELVQTVKSTYGRVDSIINNHHYLAAGQWGTGAETFPLDAWESIMRVNLTGTFLMCQKFGQMMLEQQHGNIINMASTYGIVSSNPALYTDNSLASPIAYSASKGGVIMLTKYLACYWGSRGVRVNALTPHGVWNHHEEAFDKRFSSMSPLHRMMQPEEIVGPIVFLLSEASSYMNGNNLVVDGGWTAW